MEKYRPIIESVKANGNWFRQGKTFCTSNSFFFLTAVGKLMDMRFITKARGRRTHARTVVAIVTVLLGYNTTRNLIEELLILQTVNQVSQATKG